MDMIPNSYTQPVASFVLIDIYRIVITKYLDIDVWPMDRFFYSNYITLANYTSRYIIIFSYIYGVSILNDEFIGHSWPQFLNFDQYRLKIAALALSATGRIS